MRTLVVSDLHLGSRSRVDVLQGAQAQEALVERARGADRVVVLGDLLELRHGPVRDALAAAAPLLRALGAVTGEVLLIPGNHDHRVLRPWLEEEHEGPLALDTRLPDRATPTLARVADLLGAARFEVRYPGAWLREDVFALHGHYLDRTVTIPSFERVAAGAMTRFFCGPVPEQATPDDFEVALAPLYAFMDAVADRVRDGRGAAPARASQQAWKLLNSDTRRPLRGRALALGVPIAIGALNRGGFGPLRPEINGVALRRAALEATRDVVRRLGITAPHVLFGHTHRSGPWPHDDATEWGPLINTGCWVYEPAFAGGGPRSPYWPGRAVELVDAEPPRLLGLLDELPASVLTAPARV